MTCIAAIIDAEAQAHKTDSSVDAAAYFSLYEELRQKEDNQ